MEIRAALADRNLGKGDDPLHDPQVLLAVMDKLWGPVFGAILARSDRNLVIELSTSVIGGRTPSNSAAMTWTAPSIQSGGCSHLCLLRSLTKSAR